MIHTRPILIVACALPAITLSSSIGYAQIAYGVDDETLFYFDVNNPSVVITVGELGYRPEGMDFRPGSRILYAIDIGPSTSQLYSIDIDTAESTPLGPDFTSAGPGYNLNLGPTSAYGFEVDPKSLQADGSMRIRFASTFGYNMQFHTATGQIVALDTRHRIPGSFNDTWIEGLAYINNIPEIGGTTVLYAIDSILDDLYTMSPPSTGNLQLVGPLSGVGDVRSNVQFDVFTRRGDTDLGIGGDYGFAGINAVGAPYMLYEVDLVSGVVSNGRLVGPAASPFDFRGGLALLPVPEASGIALFLLGMCALALFSRQRLA